ncbi:MAG: hypothetical protein WCW16_01105 [Candidatus Magasanikbacteria bacterium]
MEKTRAELESLLPEDPAMALLVLAGLIFAFMVGWLVFRLRAAKRVAETLNFETERPARIAAFEEKSAEQDGTLVVR